MGRETFGQWLATKRFQSGYSKVEVGLALGVNRNTVARWEKDKSLPRLNPEQLREYLHLLNETYDEYWGAYLKAKNLASNPQPNTGGNPQS